MTKYSTILPATILVLLFVSSCSHDRIHSPHQTVNPVIGDESYRKRFGVDPNEQSDEFTRVQTHLLYAEELLCNKDVSPFSPELQQSRKHLLELLHNYACAGIFPVNEKYKDQRRPCFIDEKGNICAVGYLVEQTAGRTLAESINAQFQYETISEMEMDELKEWILKSGFTAEEVATIQPTYGSYTYTYRRVVIGGGLTTRGIKTGNPAFYFGIERERNFMTKSALMRYESLGKDDYAYGLRLGLAKSFSSAVVLGGGITPSFFRNNNLSEYNLKPDLSLSYLTKKLWRFSFQFMLSETAAKQKTFDFINPCPPFSVIRHRVGVVFIDNLFVFIPK